jgi:HSP20 family molecular chaperone IbpA
VILKNTDSDIQKALISIYPLYPIFDVEESSTHYVLCLDGRVILGDEIDIELIDGEIVIQGKGKVSNDIDFSPKSVIVRSHGHSIATQYRDGLLMIALPKKSSIFLH